MWLLSKRKSTPEFRHYNFRRDVFRSQIKQNNVTSITRFSNFYIKNTGSPLLPLINLTVDHINDEPDHQNFLSTNGKELPSFFYSKQFNMCWAKKKQSTKVPLGPKIDKWEMMFTTAVPYARKYYTLTLFFLQALKINDWLKRFQGCAWQRKEQRHVSL